MSPLTESTRLVFKKPTGSGWTITPQTKVPVDPFRSQVSLLLHGNADGSGNILDSSPTPKTISKFGNAASATPPSYPNSNSVFGNSLLFSPGQTNYLSVPASSSLQITNTNNFTVESWVYLNSNRTFNFIASKGTSGTSSKEWSLSVGPTNLTFAWSENGSGDTTISRSASLPLSTWMHIAMVKSGTTIKLFKNGVQQGADGTFSTISSFNGTLWIGRFHDYTNISHDLDGYLDEFRITQTARYTSNFTPPAAPFPDI
jgi:hypothetical protein